MPPRLFSRHTAVTQVNRGDTSRYVYLSDREKFRYQRFPDNIVHTIQAGDTLHRLAARMYAPLSDPPEFSAASLWWAIADFQPQPIHDPTIALRPGHALIIPSLRTLQDRILNTAFSRGQGV